MNQIGGLLDRGHRVDIYAHTVASQDLLHSDVRRHRLLERTYSLGCPANYLARGVGGIKICIGHIRRNPRAVLGSLNVFRYGRTASSLTLLFATVPFYRRYDIVHAHFGMNGRIGAILKKLGLQKKLVVTFHGQDIRKGIEQGGQIYGDLWNEVDCLIAISQYNYDHLIRLGGDPSRIVHHPVGIDCRRFVPKTYLSGNAVRPTRLLSVARLVEEKGLSYGIRAVHKIVTERPELNVQYQIIGDGYLRCELERLIAELGLRDHVALAGAKNQDAVSEALRESDIFLSPSIAEALPVSLMEASAVGLPVIATRIGSVDQIVLDGASGFVVPARDVAAIAEKLCHLIDHPEPWPDMGRVGRRHVETNYDIDKLNDKLVELYQTLLAA